MTATAWEHELAGTRARGWWIGAPLAVAAVAVIAARTALGLGGSAYDPDFFSLYSLCEFAAAALCLARAARKEEERAAWLWLGLAQLSSFLGDTLEYALYGNGSYPSPGLLDVFWLASYPLSAAGLALLVHARFPKPEPARWLEALQATMLVSAVGLLVVFQPALHSTHGSTARTAVTLAYPLLDVILMGAVLAVFALSGFRPGRSWVVLAVGLASFVGIDSVWAVSSPSGSAADLLTAGWPTAHFLVAAAAWLPAGRPRRVGSDDWRTSLLPQAVVLVTVAIQLGAIFHYLPGGFPAARAFLIAAQALVLVKLALGPRAARRAGRRDPLTGLGNRRALDADLARVLARGQPRVLALCEVHGLDDYARACGREARDGLLRATGAQLAAAGDAYRVDGGEFWVLGASAPPGGPLDGGATLLVASATLPDEADEADAARALVERRARD